MLYKPYEQVVLNDRPLAYWRIGGPPTTASLTFPSEISNALLSSTASNFSVAEGINGAAQPKGLQTSGSAGYRYTATLSDLSTDTWSFEIWMRSTTSSTSANRGAVFGRSGNANQDDGFRYRPSTSSIEFWYNDNTAPVTLIASGAMPTSSPWTYLVATASSGGVTLWVNGRAQVSNTTVPNIALTGIYLADSPRQSYRYACVLAEPAVYGYPLAPSQIYNHYIAGLGKRTPAWTRAIYPFVAAAPPPPPGGFTAVSNVTNRRIALVSDRPR